MTRLPTSILSRYGWLCLLLLLMVSTSAWACPNCKQALANDPAQAGLVRGFFWSILFMVSMPFVLLGGLSAYFYWEVCRARRAATAAAELDVASEAGSPFVAVIPSIESPCIEDAEPVGVS